MRLAYKMNVKLIILLIILLHLLLLTKIIFFPYPELFIYPYLTEQGLIPYKHIFDQHFPGLMFFPVNLYSLGFVSPYNMRILHLGLVFVTHVLLFLVAKKLFKSKRLALIANLLYLIWQPFFEGHVLWIDSFIPPLLLVSLYFLSEKKLSSSKIFVSGVVMGITLIFKQVTAPLIIFIFLYLKFYKNESFKKITLFILGSSIFPLIMVVYFYALGALRDFVFWTFTFNVTTFAQMGRKLPSLSGLIKSVPVFGLGLIASLYFVYIERRGKANAIRILLIVFFVGGLFFAYARFDFIHLQPALPFTILLGLLLFEKVNPRRLIGFGLVYGVIGLYLLSPLYRFNWNNRVLFFGEFEKKLSSEVQKYSKKNDSVFAFGTTTHLNYLTNTLPPGKVFVFPFPWFMVEAEGKILEGIKNDPPKVVVRDLTATTGGVNLVSFMPEISTYVVENYRVIEKIENAEIMIPK